MELGILCGTEIAVVMFDKNGLPIQFSSRDLDHTLSKFLNVCEKENPKECYGPGDVGSYAFPRAVSTRYRSLSRQYPKFGKGADGGADTAAHGSRDESAAASAAASAMPTDPRVQHAAPVGHGEVFASAFGCTSSPGGGSVFASVDLRHAPPNDESR